MAKNDAAHDLDASARRHLLIIRFSSFGDIIHGIGVPAAFKAHFPGAAVDWLVRADLKGLVDDHPAIDRVIPFERKSGWLGLLKTSWQLARSDYTHVYDAHSNVRAFFVRAIFRLAGSKASVVRRSKDRFRRWLLFALRRNTLPRPFRSADSFHRPLVQWGLPPTTPPGAHYFPKAALPPEIETELAKLPRPLYALAPSAAWEMKRWPIEHWLSFMRQVGDGSFVLLGGPEDGFIENLTREFPNRALNVAGRLSLAQSASVLARADLIVANDTGMMHAADQMERPTIALIGPTAFGYPSPPKSRALEIELPCKPCSKDGSGRCVNDLYKRCLVDLKPEAVIAAAREMTK